MAKYQRTLSSTQISPNPAENLYELGLLPRPVAKQSGNNHRTQARNHRDITGDRTASSMAVRSYESFKKASITSGTLARPVTPHDQLSYPTTTREPFVSASRSGNAAHTGMSMSTMLEQDRPRIKRDRTFIGGACAVCEELLEHTLQGERVLQFSCSHVAHEACIYEYLRDADAHYCPTCNSPLGLDSFRGGNVLDLHKLSSMVKSVTQKDLPELPRASSHGSLAWERQTIAPDDSSSTRDHTNLSSRDNPNRDSKDSQRLRIERLGIGKSGHTREDSGHASNEYSTEQNTHTRRHDYDLHAMETSVQGSQLPVPQQTIPAPIVTVRSEFPTLTRSSQQQSLTCLVTVEVPECKWQRRRPDFDMTQPLPPLPSKFSPALQSRATINNSVISNTTWEQQMALESTADELRRRVDNWHGLEFHRFGKLKLFNNIRVGKDRQSWQELECYLFGEMLICVKEKKNVPAVILEESGRTLPRCTLKGSILIKKHLKQVQSFSDDLILTLNLSVNELPTFHLQFESRHDLELWQHSLLNINKPDSPNTTQQEFDADASGTDEDEYTLSQPVRRISSAASSNGVRTVTTAPTEYSSHQNLPDHRLSRSLHVPVDIIVVIPVSSSMQGLKISLLKDTLRFLVHNLGDHDRMGLVTFGSSGGGVPLVGMTTKTWSDWSKVLDSIRPVGQKSLRADVVEGANVAMDLLMQRKAANPVSSILLISDSSTAESEGIDFVVQRAEAAKVGIYSFGLGLSHKPDSMIEMSTRTKSSYLYVKDWMMLRECAAGVLGSLQSTSHQNVRLRLKLPEGSPAKFTKISGAWQTTKRATGRDAEASIGDLRFGDKRDILVQLTIEPDDSTQDNAPPDAWESIVSGLEALGGSLDHDEPRPQSIEEVPLLQADLTFGDLQHVGTSTPLARPSLLAITMLPATHAGQPVSRPSTPPIPPHPSIVQRRMEMLASDMLSRALTLVARGQHDRAHHLLSETRTILKGLGKGGLPPLPANNPASKRQSPPSQRAATPRAGTPDRGRDASPSPDGGTPVRRPAVDSTAMNALDADIETALEWINHPAVFSRDSRKAVLQAIGVISAQRAYTFRSASESLWAQRVRGVKDLIGLSREWREVADDALTEEQ